MNLRQLINEIEAKGLSQEDAIDDLYTRVCDYWFDWSVPLNVGDFKFFMNQLANWVKMEHKKVIDGPTSAQSRSDTIAYIKEVVVAKGQGLFAGIDPFIFGVQLALRIRRPRTVNQGATGLCGPASFVYNFAKGQPQQFAQFALNLFFDGYAILGKMEIRPSAAIFDNYRLRKNSIRWAVDYVTLVSLRQCTFLADAPGLKSFRGADETTLPGQLAAWLSQAGYSNVQDHTFFGKNQQKAVQKFAKAVKQPMHFGNSTAEVAVQEDRLKHAGQSLRAAHTALTTGNVLFFFIDGELADALQNKRSGSLFGRKDPTSLGKHHWVTIRQMEISGSAVRIKAFTWGETYNGWFDMDSFLSRYNGYISAQP